VAFPAKLRPRGHTGESHLPVTAHTLAVIRFFEVDAGVVIMARGARNIRISFFQLFLVKYILTVFIIVMARKAFEIAHMKFMGEEDDGAMVFRVCVGIVQYEFLFPSTGEGQAEQDHYQSQYGRQSDIFFK